MKISLDEFKEHLTQQIENITLETIELNTQEIKQAIDILNSLHEANMLIENKIIEKHEMHESSEKDPPEETIEMLPTQTIDEPHKFIKQLSGGYLEGVNDSYIRESVVRSLGLQNGNHVKYEDGKLTILDKEEEVNTVDFTLYKYCPVKKEGGLYYCDDTVNGTPLRYNEGEVLHTFRISDYIMQKFNISEGDLLDVGYDRVGWRVVWKHDIDKEAYTKPLPSAHYKDKPKKQEKESDIDLMNKIILIIGLHAKKVEYQNAIESANGQFRFMSGNENLKRVHTACNSVDVVLLLKDYLSHSTVKTTVSHCKARNIPFKVVDGLGVQAILKDAEEEVKKL